MIQDTEELFPRYGSSSVSDSRGRKHGDTDWLPDGWDVEVKSKKSGQKYKVNEIDLSRITMTMLTMLYSYLISISFLTTCCLTIFLLFCYCRFTLIPREKNSFQSLRF